jgi:hypothetical protein
MSRRPLLALLRGLDGRSLARGLVVLVFVNVLLAGLHGGALALSAALDTPAICTLAGANSDPGHPGNDLDYRTCCVLGLNAVANVVPPSPPALADTPPAVVMLVPVPPPAGHATPHPLDGPANPRGPPLLG